MEVQGRRLSSQQLKILKRLHSNPVETKKTTSTTRSRRRRRSSAGTGTTSGGESPSAAAASTAFVGLDEEWRRRQFNSGKGNIIKNTYIPPKSRGLGLYGYGGKYRDDRTDRPFGNEFNDDAGMSFDQWEVNKDMAESRKRNKRVQSAPDVTMPNSSCVSDDLHATPNGDQVMQFPPTFLKKPQSTLSAMASEEEVREEYSASLSRLTTNMRPLIINLTELANEYKRPHARLIASLIEGRIRTVRTEQKMPALYLLDSIIKNHGDPYRAIFQPNLVSIFAVVFGANESPNVRMALHKLRNTWNSIFDPRVLESLDIRVQREFDPKWPIQIE